MRIAKSNLTTEARGKASKEPDPSLRSGFRQKAPAALTPSERLKFHHRVDRGSRQTMTLMNSLESDQHFPFGSQFIPCHSEAVLWPKNPYVRSYTLGEYRLVTCAPLTFSPSPIVPTDSL